MVHTEVAAEGMAGSDPVESDERGVADGGEGVVEDGHGEWVVLARYWVLGTCYS